jgi:hypothetical protein
MLNVDLIRKRLGQYGGAWLASFLLVLIGDLAAVLFHVPLAAAANVLLLVALAGLAVGFAVFVAYTVLAKQSGATRTVLLTLGVLLLFPLLWAPMLGAVASAFFAHAAIEYSGVYAGFRIIVGQAIYFIMRLFTNNPYVEAGLQALQVLATIVGFIASLAQLYQTFVAPRVRRETPAEG